MPPLALFRDYIIWHYSVAYLDMLYVWWNYLWFINHMFSVPDVALSLFSPFKRLQEKKVNILKDPEEFLGNMFVNLIMRIVGAVIRLALLLIAAIMFAATLVIGGSIFLIWSFLPILVVYYFTTGIGLLFS
jgi:hypothetical protein